MVVGGCVGGREEEVGRSERRGERGQSEKRKRGDVGWKSAMNEERYVKVRGKGVGRREEKVWEGERSVGRRERCGMD